MSSKTALIRNGRVIQEAGAMCPGDGWRTRERRPWEGAPPPATSHRVTKRAPYSAG
jgi:hypothetical protein